MLDFLFAAGALGEDLRPTVLRAIERQAAPLDQHPAAYDVINHQQQEPDGDRGFKPGEQRLRRGEIADRRRQHRYQRRAEQHIPQQPVQHIVAAAFFVEIQRNAGAFQAQGHHRQRAANQHKAEAAQRGGELAIVEVIESNQRHNQRHDQPDAHQVVAHRFADAAARPAKVGDKQAVRAGERGANHHDPQQRYRGGDAIANRHGQRERPGGLQPVAQRHPQHRQRRGHQYGPEHRAQGEPEVILRNLTDARAGALKEAGEMAA